MANADPFKGRVMRAPAPMRILHSFKKGLSRAEIRERKVISYNALEFLVFVDGSLLESQMFHSQRVAEYPGALAQRIKQFTDDGWSEVHTGSANS